jgi:hypothetical protein
VTTPTRQLVLDAVTETEWQRVVMNYAHFKGWLVYHIHDSRLQEWGTDAGFPDLVLARDGHVVFVELKDKRGRLSKAQQRWIDAMEPGDVEVYVWRPTDEDEMRRVLE